MLHCHVAIMKHVQTAGQLQLQIVVEWRMVEFYACRYGPVLVVCYLLAHAAQQVAPYSPFCDGLVTVLLWRAVCRGKPERCCCTQLALSLNIIH